MDVSEYLPMFLAEGREHLQELNLAVVRIEDQPDDRMTSMRLPATERTVWSASRPGRPGGTIRVDVATGTVTFREAGGRDIELPAGRPALELVA